MNPPSHIQLELLIPIAIPYLIIGGVHVRTHGLEKLHTPDMVRFGSLVSRCFALPQAANMLSFDDLCLYSRDNAAASFIFAP